MQIFRAVYVLYIYIHESKSCAHRLQAAAAAGPPLRLCSYFVAAGPSGVTGKIYRLLILLNPERQRESEDDDGRGEIIVGKDPKIFLCARAAGAQSQFDFRGGKIFLESSGSCNSVFPGSSAVVCVCVYVWCALELVESCDFVIVR